MPAVSVIMPAFRAARTIGESIQSCLDQTFDSWELLVVDDCSPDDTASIVADYAASDSRVRLIRNPVNKGPSGSRTAALSEARGRFVAFLDSDDVWLPRKLERQLGFMESTGAALSYTAYRRISEDGTRTGALVKIPATVTYRQLLKQTCIATLTALVDTQQTGSLEMPNAYYDDYALWLKILRAHGAAHGLNEDLARYRVMEKSVSSNKLKSAGKVWRVYRDHTDLSLPGAAYYFVHYAMHGMLKHARF